MSKTGNRLSLGDGIAAAVGAYVIDAVIDAMSNVLLTCGVVGALVALFIAFSDDVSDYQELIAHIVAKEFLFLLGFGLGVFLLFGSR